MKKVYTMISSVLPLICICFFTNLVYGQTITPSADRQNAVSRFVHHERVAFKLDYFGELALHPGMTVGVEYTLSKNKLLAVHWDNDLGGYWHRWNNTSFFIKSSLGVRFAMGSVFADLNAGIGYMHSFAAGTIYQRASDGGVEKAHNWGHSHFMPNASFLLGWDGTRKGKQLWKVHFGPEVYLQSSFNHIFLPHVAVKVGLTYKFKQQ